MVAGARQWSGGRGSPATQRNSSLLVSARQVQALVRPAASSAHKQHAYDRKDAETCPQDGTPCAPGLQCRSLRAGRIVMHADSRAARILLKENLRIALSTARGQSTEGNAITDVAPPAHLIAVRHMRLVARGYSPPTRNADELGLEHSATGCRPSVASDPRVQVSAA